MYFVEGNDQCCRGDCFRRHGLGSSFFDIACSGPPEENLLVSEGKPVYIRALVYTKEIYYEDALSLSRHPFRTGLAADIEYESG